MSSERVAAEETKKISDMAVLKFCMKFGVDPGTGLPIEFPAKKPCGVGNDLMRETGAYRQAYAEGWNAYRDALIRRVTPAKESEAAMSSERPTTGDWRAEAESEAERIVDDWRRRRVNNGEYTVSDSWLEELSKAIASALSRAHSAGAATGEGLLRECRGYLSRGHTHPAYRDELIVRLDAHLAQRGQEGGADGR